MTSRSRERLESLWTDTSRKVPERLITLQIKQTHFGKHFRASVEYTAILFGRRQHIYIHTGGDLLADGSIQSNV